ncbi:unnamed protein product [Dovyalis caffra]|uniref:Uncharacterized protein n=1 Tax=Dovyalis caffra TaxID=77055 RepID=A0AAV1RY26_9ROSI|nr:unnamed protein product [Dovyalis caffra]
MPGLEEDDDEEVYRTVSLNLRKIMDKKWNVLPLIELFGFVCIMGLLIASLTIDRLLEFKDLEFEIMEMIASARDACEQVKQDYSSCEEQA